jgi:hypothetical protein
MRDLKIEFRQFKEILFIIDIENVVHWIHPGVFRENNAIISMVFVFILLLLDMDWRALRQEVILDGFRDLRRLSRMRSGFISVSSRVTTSK